MQLEKKRKLKLKQILRDNFKMTSTIIGKRLIYEGDELLKNKKYSQAINKFLECKRVGYFGVEVTNRLYFIANCINNYEIKDKDVSNIEPLFELGKELLYGSSGKLEDEITGMGFLIILNFIPEEKISRDTKMYMNYLSDLNC